MGKNSCGDEDDDVLPLLLLPEDFLINILVCLPVKSLLRFKSVCKSWRALIQTSFFIDLHTTTTTTTTSSSKYGTFILQATEPSDIKLFMLSSSGDGDGDGEDDDEEDDQKKKKMVFKVDDLGVLPFNKYTQLSHTLRMVGSCNGIICLHDPELVDNISKGCIKQHYSNLRDVSLWNPATRQFRILPKSIPIEERKHGYGDFIGIGTLFADFIAFGFDVKTKDYKVLRITPFIPVSYRGEGGGCMCRVQVYSLSTDSWRLLEDINYLPVVPTQELFVNHGIYMNGSYFFVGTKSYTDGIRDDFMLLSFDFTKEIFTTMQLPDNCSRLKVVLSYLGDKITVFSFENCDGSYEYYDIWVLNEQPGRGSSVVVNKESWTKLHSFRIKSRGYPCTEPRCISNNGEFALISTRTGVGNDGYWRTKLQLFNLVTKEAKQDFLIGTLVCRADVYRESLISIMGGNVLP